MHESFALKSFIIYSSQCEKFPMQSVDNKYKSIAKMLIYNTIQNKHVQDNNQKNYGQKQYTYKFQVPWLWFSSTNIINIIYIKLTYIAFLIS